MEEKNTIDTEINDNKNIEENGNNIDSIDNSNSSDEKKKGKNQYLTPLAIVIAGILISASVIYSDGQENVAKLPDSTPKTDDSQPEITSEDAYLGNKESKIKIVEYSDFNCGFCGKFFSDAGARIREKYVDTGKAIFVYKHFAFLGPESNRAAEASECAKDQSQFWEYHDLLFEKQQEISFSDDNLKKLAGDSGLNTDQFNECLDSDKYKAKVKQDTSDAKKLGINGTPAVFINSTMISGAQPFETFEEIIEEELGKI